jgi:hypothetical protein
MSYGDVILDSVEIASVFYLKYRYNLFDKKKYILLWVCVSHVFAFEMQKKKGNKMLLLAYCSR